MNMKLLATTAIAASLISGIAYAQSTPDVKGTVGTSTTSESNDSTTGGQGAGAMKSDSSMKSGNSMEYKSDDERSMYDTMGDKMSAFFTDDSMSEMKSKDEIQATFAAMGADDQAQMKEACDRAMSNRGSYGSVTVGLCQQISGM